MNHGNNYTYAKAIETYFDNNVSFHDPNYDLLHTLRRPLLLWDAALPPAGRSAHDVTGPLHI